MAKQVIILAGPAQRAYAAKLISAAPDGYAVTVSEPTRTTDQNAKLWPMLDDIAGQTIWHGMDLSRNDWKEIFTASLKKCRVAPNLEGNGFVVLGLSSSNLSKREFSDLIELIYAFGAERGVVWSEPNPYGERK
jgi:hypothetical protein